MNFLQYFVSFSKNSLKEKYRRKYMKKKKLNTKSVMPGNMMYNFRLLCVEIVLKNVHRVKELHMQSIYQMLVINANKTFTLTA